MAQVTGGIRYSTTSMWFEGYTGTTWYPIGYIPCSTTSVISAVEATEPSSAIVSINYLGTAAAYSIATAAGLSATGVNSMNLGLAIGSGVAPGTTSVGGATHVADTTQAQVQADVNTAMAYYNGLTPTGSISGDLINLTITPGIYSSGTLAIQCSGTLKLDAQNQPDSLFIFQIGGAFTPAANSSVLLLNGAKSANVYWAISPTWTFGASAHAVGTYISTVAGAISTLGANVTIDGRMLCYTLTMSSGVFNTTVSLSKASRLSTAYGYSVLGSTVTNVGPSYANWDVGSSAVSPVSASLAVGIATHSGDAAGALGLTDVATAIAYYKGLTATGKCTSELGGTTFTAGIYSNAGNLSNSGTVTFNASGNSNALFIFQVGGALSTGAGSTFLLTNTAMSANVYWQVTSNVVAGAGSHMVGTVLGGTTLTLGSGASVDGRAMALSNVTMCSNTVTTGATSGSASVSSTAVTSAASSTISTGTSTATATTSTNATTCNVFTLLNVTSSNFPTLSFRFGVGASNQLTLFKKSTTGGLQSLAAFGQPVSTSS